MEASAIGVADGRPRLRTFWQTLDAGQRRTLLMMVAVVVALHVVGFVTLLALVAPNHYHLGASGTFTIELENEFDKRMAHRTQRYGSSKGSGPIPWLGS